MRDYIKNLLEGKHSNATAQFFCGDYFTEIVTNHPDFSKLQEMVWELETRLYKSLSKRARARRTLCLAKYPTQFFETSQIHCSFLAELQGKILGDWIATSDHWGLTINWHSVFKSAYRAGVITKTNADFDKLESMMEIPRY